MKTKEIRNFICENYWGAETLQRGTLQNRIRFLMSNFDCSYSTAYYLAKEARNTPYVFDHKGGLNY